MFKTSQPPIVSYEINLSGQCWHFSQNNLLKKKLDVKFRLLLFFGNFRRIENSWPTTKGDPRVFWVYPLLNNSQSFFPVQMTLGPKLSATLGATLGALQKQIKAADKEDEISRSGRQSYNATETWRSTLIRPHTTHPKKKTKTKKPSMG